MIVLDIGGHPLGAEAQEAIREMLGDTADIREFGAWDVGSPATGEELRNTVAALIRRFPVTQQEWVEDPPVLVLPGFSPSVAMLLALLHGAGGFPRLIVMTKDADDRFTRPMLVDLARARDWGRRHLRYGA